MLKMQKINKTYGYLVLLVIASVTGLLYYYTPHTIMQLANISWVALLIALLFVVTPLGSRKLTLPEDLNPITLPKKKKKVKSEPLQKKLPKGEWLGKIMLLQVSVLLILYGAAALSAKIVPLGSPEKIAFNQTLSESLLHLGLFPWALITFFAISFALVAFNHNKDCFYNQITLAPFSKLGNFYRVIMDNIARNMSYFSLAIAAVIATISLAGLMVGTGPIQSITGLKIGAIGGVILMCTLAFKRKTHYALQAIQTQKPNFGMLITLVLWAVFLALAGLIVHHLSHGKVAALPSGVLAPLITKGYMLHWQLFATGLLFCFVPLLSVFIAYYSYGYSVRAMVCASLILPIALGLLFGFNQHYHFIQDLGFNQRLALGAPLVGLVLLIYLTCKKKTIAMTNLLFLAKPGEIKPRSMTNYFERWKKYSGVIFYLMLPASIYVTAVFLILGIITSVITFVLALWSLFIILKKTP